MRKNQAKFNPIKKSRNVASQVGKIKKIIPKKSKKDIQTIGDTNIPKITNENVAEHRSEVLSDAKKFIYPLAHSKYKVVLMSVGVAFILLLANASYFLISIYSLKAHNSFIYQVSSTIPFPVARAGGRFVLYEDFLFDLRRFKFYFESQHNVDFTTEEGKQQLKEQQKRSLDKVVNDAYIAKLAKENNVTVTDQEIEEEISVLKEYNKLSTNQKDIDIVLRDFYNWNMRDFKKHLRLEKLGYKVLYALDQEPMKKAQQAKSQLDAGIDFAEVAKATSEEPGAKETGGLITEDVTINSRIGAMSLKTLFGLKAGETSGILNEQNRLVIYKVNEVNGDKLKVSSIVFNYRDINDFINDEKSKSKAKVYISF